MYKLSSAFIDMSLVALIERIGVKSASSSVLSNFFYFHHMYDQLLLINFDDIKFL